MYSDLIIDQSIHRGRKAGLQFRRLPRERSIEFAEHLERLRIDPGTRKVGGPGYLSRSLNKEENAFIESEQNLCRVDFSYFFERYYKMILDPGVGNGNGISSAPMLESQRRYVKLLGRREIECHEEMKKYRFTEGILAYFHKCRQVLATTTARAMSWHRMLFYAPVRGLFATLGDAEVTEVFSKRDHVFLDNLAWWLKPPKLDPDKDNDEIGFPHPLNSFMTYRTENAESGFGTGSQIDVSHLTEVGLYKYPSRIGFSFIPTLPKAITTLHIQESTSSGKGYWMEVTESARWHRKGFESYTYIFIPWWMNMTKYRANVPDSWTPDEATQRHADLIERTSPEFYDGQVFRPNRSQLYWWESTRSAHVRRGELAEFLTNYPATPEQSFQSSSQGALPPELLEIMEAEVMNPGGMYEYELSNIN